MLGIDPTRTGWLRSRISSTPTLRLTSLRTSSFDRPRPPRPIRQARSTRSTWALKDLTLVRYDNAHEETKGHERHTATGDTDDIKFPGMEALLVEF